MKGPSPAAGGPTAAGWYKPPGVNGEAPMDFTNEGTAGAAPFIPGRCPHGFRRRRGSRRARSCFRAVLQKGSAIKGTLGPEPLPTVLHRRQHTKRGTGDQAKGRPTVLYRRRHTKRGAGVRAKGPIVFWRSRRGLFLKSSGPVLCGDRRFSCTGSIFHWGVPPFQNTAGYCSGWSGLSPPGLLG